ncbi:DUF4387 domain-containing protein [uncultured Sphaerochaeta sp.]|uniref:DUF4387 domain-containing protein n=1 Tax=uncultured Sphaerochaeta sp. TaxID=886478 RepID=UPI002A0A373A|nr:DUF4387 domain-containing protein [uncultured Sphaerochaeta sp.]
MDRLVDLAQILRSKNSGPFLITLDILFSDSQVYERVVKSGMLNEKAITELYHLKKGMLCGIYFFPTALGIKITYHRSISSGTCGDSDVYGAQQHAPLMELLIP